MSAPIVSGHRSRTAVLAALLGASLLAAGLVGCGGGSSDTRDVLLPPGGVAIGNLVCTGTPEPWTNEIQHGQIIDIRFTLTDVNTQLVGANLPVSFDIVGGTLLDPPTHTDENGVVRVRFFASNPLFTGAGRVRLVQPEARLDCDVSFTVIRPPCILRATIIDGNGNVIGPADACGYTELGVERHLQRRIIYRVTRLNPFTGGEDPVVGAFIRLRANGLTWGDLRIGPTDADGRFTREITPFETGEGVALVSFLEDTPCTVCNVGFEIVNSVCDANGQNLAVTYLNSAGAASGLTHLRPGDSARVTAQYLVDGTPQAGRRVLVDADSGMIEGSTLPYRATTDASGYVTVRYTAVDGFSGADTIRFMDEVGTLDCTQTATVNVRTCDIELRFGAPVTSGADVPLTVHLLNVDPTTAIGEIVALDVVGGFFTEQPPYYEVVNHMGTPAVMTTLHVTPGFSGAASLAVSWVSGYGCTTVSEPFTVSP